MLREFPPPFTLFQIPFHATDRQRRPNPHTASCGHPITHPHFLRRRRLLAGAGSATSAYTSMSVWGMQCRFRMWLHTGRGRRPGAAPHPLAQVAARGHVGDPVRLLREREDEHLVVAVGLVQGQVEALLLVGRQVVLRVVPPREGARVLDEGDLHRRVHARDDGRDAALHAVRLADPALALQRRHVCHATPRLGRGSHRLDPTQQCSMPGPGSSCGGSGTSDVTTKPSQLRSCGCGARGRLRLLRALPPLALAPAPAGLFTSRST